MRNLILVLVATVLAACSGEKSKSEAPEVIATEVKATEVIATEVIVTEDAKIGWYEGSIEQAFADAEAAGSPVFLYWGAVWCPPCQEIKHTVFKSQQFINLTKLFVPVYLDGDTDQAQAWGEKFGVKGYPTMIVFNPAGEEVTRIPGGIDISKYNTVLELSLNEMQPTSRLVEIAMANPDELDSNDFMQLAYYSWGQDFTALPEDIDATALFYDLSNRAPEAEARARFYMEYLVGVAQEYKSAAENDDPEAQPGEVPLAEGDNVVARLTELLGSEELTLFCWDSLAYYFDEILELPIYADEEKQVLSGLWEDKIFALRQSESLSKAEKLAGWLPKLYFKTAGDEMLPADLQAQLKQELQLVEAATPDSYERQSVINQMSHIYRQAKMTGVAKELLFNELGKSASPYYFMSSLSALAENQENFEEAIAWRRKAYEASTGEATRFQWGATYIRVMIKLSPENTEAITSQSVALLEEFHETHEVFAGRNFRILQRLNEELSGWQESRQLSDLAFKEAVRSMCDGQAEGSLESENCESLFVEKALTQAST